LSGDGLVPPLNAPPAGIIVPGVQPGVSNAVILAQYVIVFGTAGGVFIYTGAPAAGNPPIAWMSGATADPYGNTLTPASHVVIGAGQDGSPQVVLESSSGSGELAFPLPGTWTNYPNMFGAVAGSGGTLSLNGPTDTTVNDQAYLEMLSAAAGYEGGSAGAMHYKDANGGDNTIAIWGDNGLLINVAQPINAVKPGTGGSPTNPAQPEPWHTPALTTVTGSGNGVNGMRYKLMPFNCLLLEWDLATNSVGNNVTVATLPAGWRPATAHNIASGSYGGATALTTGTNPHFVVNTAGTIVTGGFPAINFDVCGTALIGLD
jgi:hypothetical protein